MNTFICYPSCSTCKRAEQFLKDNNIKYEVRNIKEDNPTAEELAKFVIKSGKDIKGFFNTSGLVYKKLGLKDKLNDMDESQKISILSTNGMLVKRPILLTDEKVYVGFNEKEWNELIR